MRCMYVLATGYDVIDDCSTSDDGDKTAVWILAVDCRPKDGSTTYQIFSSTSGVWSPVKCSAKLPEDVVFQEFTSPIPGGSGSVVVCHGAVTWFVYLGRDRRTRKCMPSRGSSIWAGTEEHASACSPWTCAPNALGPRSAGPEFFRTWNRT
jgi:hypothetical protein